MFDGWSEILAVLPSPGQLFKHRLSPIHTVHLWTSLLVIHIGENPLYNDMSLECNSILHINKVGRFCFQSFYINWIFQKYYCNVYWRIVYCLIFNFTKKWFPLWYIMPSTEPLLFVLGTSEQHTPTHQCAFTTHAPFMGILCTGARIWLLHCIFTGSCSITV